MMNSSWSHHLCALAASALWLAGCFANESAGGDPKPEPPEGLGLAYDTAAGVVTATWHASLEYLRRLLTPRPAPIPWTARGTVSRPWSSPIRSTATLCSAVTSGSLRVISHYSVQSLVHRNSGAVCNPIPCPVSEGSFPPRLPFQLFLSYGKSVAVRRAGLPSPRIPWLFPASRHPASPSTRFPFPSARTRPGSPPRPPASPWRILPGAPARTPSTSARRATARPGRRLRSRRLLSPCERQGGALPGGRLGLLQGVRRRSGRHARHLHGGP